MSHLLSLSEAERKQYKRWIAYGELKRIEASFGKECYEKALAYIAKKATEWLHLFEVGFPTTVTVTNSAKKKATVPDATSDTKKKCASKKRDPVDQESPKKRSRKAKSTSSKEKKPTSTAAPTISPFSLQPRRRVPYRPRYAEVSIGDAVRLVIPAYKEFIDGHSTLFAESLVNEAESIISEYQKIPLSIVEGRVIGLELLLSISEDVCSLSIQCANGNVHSVLMIKPTSALLQTATHVIREDAYRKSIQFLQEIHQKFNGIVTTDRALSLSKDTCICEIFAAPDAKPTDPLNGECYEGTIYDVNEDALENPYRAIHVIWYGRSASTGKWVVDCIQTENDASPWELLTSKYAEPASDMEQIVRAPLSGSYKEIIETLRSRNTCPEGCSIFDEISELLSDSHYCSIISNPMDFKTVNKKLEEGQYNGEKASMFWTDLETIVSNAKRFNQVQSLEWRAADVLECTLNRIKADIEFKRIRYVKE